MKIISTMLEYVRNKKYLRKLQGIFTRGRIVDDLSSLPAYPPKIFLGPRNIHAYLVQFMVPKQDVENVFRFIAQHFPFDQCSPGHDVITTNQSGKTIQVSVRHEFNGVMFDLITNSTEFLKSLDATQVQPPPPWLVFPRVTDPDVLGSLQGDIEYWWNGYWSPYWDGLTDQQRAEYLKSVDASKEWIECIEAHRSKH